MSPVIRVLGLHPFVTAGGFEWAFLVASNAQQRRSWVGGMLEPLDRVRRGLIGLQCSALSGRPLAPASMLLPAFDVVKCSLSISMRLVMQGMPWRAPRGSLVCALRSALWAPWAFPGGPFQDFFTRA